MGKTYCYIRISTDKQETIRQQNILKDRGYIDGTNCEYYEEVFTGKSVKRPVLDKILNEITCGDTLVCESLTRLSRSGVIRTLELISELVMNKGINVVILKENFNLRGGEHLDANTSLLLGIFSVLSQFERDLISERTVEGLKARKLQGVKLGRKRNSKSDINNFLKTIILLRDNDKISQEDACFMTKYPVATFKLDLKHFYKRYETKDYSEIIKCVQTEINNGNDPFRLNLV